MLLLIEGKPGSLRAKQTVPDIITVHQLQYRGTLKPTASKCQSRVLHDFFVPSSVTKTNACVDISHFPYRALQRDHLSMAGIIVVKVSFRLLTLYQQHIHISGRLVDLTSSEGQKVIGNNCVYRAADRSRDSRNSPGDERRRGT